MKYLDRTHKYLIQTPQTIQYKHWSEIKVINPQKITDLFTYLNIKIKQTNLVLGSLWNFKITTVEDLKLI
jgi:2-C-methyl-D-erythritol 4-phosphate cytidylyltransferase